MFPGLPVVTIIELVFPDQRRHRKRLQLGLFYSPDCGGVLLYAQPGAGRSQRVSLS